MLAIACVHTAASGEWRTDATHVLDTRLDRLAYQPDQPDE